jgi:hypothetical protein
VKERRVARQHDQLEDARRARLEHLAVPRLFVDRHDTVLPRRIRKARRLLRAHGTAETPIATTPARARRAASLLLVGARSDRVLRIA